MSYEIEEGTFEAPAKVNPFTDIVAKHVADAAENPGASRTITVPVDEAQKVQLQYQKAANDAGKTAKLRVKDESGVKDGKPDADGNPTKIGNVKLTFTITTRNKARRNKAAEDARRAENASA